MGNEPKSDGIGRMRGVACGEVGCSLSYSGAFLTRRVPVLAPLTLSLIYVGGQSKDV